VDDNFGRLFVPKIKKYVQMINNTHNKKFDEWFLIKPKLDKKSKFATYKMRDVFWCSLGENIGSEENGKNNFFTRPVAVIKVFNKEFCLIVPLTTKTKENKYYVNFMFNTKAQSAMISQIKSVDVRRFGSKIGTLSEKDFNLITSEIINFWQN
jgi:mRNA interferase MazF